MRKSKEEGKTAAPTQRLLTDEEVELLRIQQIDILREKGNTPYDDVRRHLDECYRNVTSELDNHFGRNA